MEMRGHSQRSDEETSSALQSTPQNAFGTLQPPTLKSTPERPERFAPQPWQPSSNKPRNATEDDAARCYGRILTVNTTPPSLVIIPEDNRLYYDLATGLSRERLVAFLHLIAAGEIRVSYVLHPSGENGMMMAEDVWSVE